MDCTSRDRFPWLWVLSVIAAVPSLATAGDWPSWRGPEQNGVSRETKLPSALALKSDGAVGAGFLWHHPEGGRSTPIVMDGRVYVVNNAGSGASEQERVLCLDANSGKVLWQYRFNIFLTDIPSNRVGWSNPTGDPETGYVYAHGVQNTFVCLDKSGKVVWERSLHEELGVIMGYGGRTHTPIIDGDLVILSFLNASWGKQGPGRHRYFAFDKRTGSIVWSSTPGGPPLDTTYSTPIIRVINGQRLLIAGNADGSVYAMKVRTGEKVWGFKLSKRGINVSVVEGGGKVYVSHSEENTDSVSMGRIVCIDATGQGDVTKTHEVWRIDAVTAGYSSPALDGENLYVFENAANLLCVDAKTGKEKWKHNVGTVMKGSPVVGDGKVYVGEVNGRFSVLEPGETSCKTVSEITFSRPDGTVVEIFGSPAIANGRIYFTSRDGVYCVGAAKWDGESGSPPGLVAEKPATGDPALLQIVPGDIVLAPGASAFFKGRLFNADGAFLKETPVTWSLQGLDGAIETGGKLTINGKGYQAGTVNGSVGGLSASARVRVVPNLPIEADFAGGALNKPPTGWVGAGIKFVNAELEGERVLTKVGKNPKFMDAETFLGRSSWKNYTVEADVYVTEVRRNMPNVGLINQRYSFVLMGNHQRARIVTWIPQPRLEVKTKFKWDPKTWYRLKFRVEQHSGKAKAFGKIWERDGEEPAAWTVEAEDTTPNTSGSPALHGYSAGISSRSAGAKIYYDNIKVYPNAD